MQREAGAYEAPPPSPRTSSCRGDHDTTNRLRCPRRSPGWAVGNLAEDRPPGPGQYIRTGEAEEESNGHNQVGRYGARHGSPPNKGSLRTLPRRLGPDYPPGAAPAYTGVLARLRPASGARSRQEPGLRAACPSSFGGQLDAVTDPARENRLVHLQRR